MMTQELDLEDPLAIVQRLNADDGTALIAALTDDEAQTLVDRLKAGADKYWAINPNRSLEMADTIITIAAGRDNLSHKALGMMARGDALKLLGHSQEAWDILGEAGEVFLQSGDEVGWARTRIGRLYLCVSLNKVTLAQEDGEHARTIFTRFGLDDFLMRLDYNIAWVYFILGNQQQSLKWYNSALITASSSNSIEKQFLGLIYLNIGAVYSDLVGDFRTALIYCQLTIDSATKRSEIKNIVLAKHNLAYLALNQGQFQQALKLFYEVLDLCEIEGFPFDANHINKLIVECYLSLNRFSEARSLAYQVINYFHANSALYDEAYTFLYLATAEAGLSNLDLAREALNSAEKIFRELGSATWLAVTRLRLGYIALKQGDLITANIIADDSVAFFQESKQLVNYGIAILLKGQVCFRLNNPISARFAAFDALNVARNANIPSLRYSSHLLLGRIAENNNDVIGAVHRYRAANATIERVQRDLTLNLQVGFSEDKGEAFQLLIALYLNSKDFVRAFEVLEHAKSQLFFTYINNRHLLHWSQDDSKCQILLQELDQLRGEHYWWYQKAHGSGKNKQIKENVVPFEDALKEITIREHRMRAITEQLYLQTKETADLLPTLTPQLEDIQRNLDEQTLLLEFYHDSKSIWIFTIDTMTCNVYRASASISLIERELNFLHFNIDTALNLDSNAKQISTLSKQATYLLLNIYEGLLATVATQIHDYQRLTFVPYGSLHYLPFHLLFDGTSYLIQNHEIVVLPTAGYLTRIGPSRTGGARVIAHSFNGSLFHTISEAQSIHDLFGGTVCVEDAASRSAFQEPPCQILHIATHAEYRQHQPDLSYIELADGHLFTDDLFQQDMSYELVTLSACETGRSRVASSDELIGLGRGFLYAGAGALVTSLWRVIDDVTPRLMEYFYRELHAGASKAAALRAAQLAILHENPNMHPAFWGAFQLVGDPRPLSSNPNAKNVQ